MRTIDCDYLVVGSGIAGSMAAMGLAGHGRVLLVTKSALDEANTAYAQGGISCVMGTDDTFDLHVADTLDAGAGLCHEDVVRRIVEAGPACLRKLIDMGVPFTKGEGSACPEGFDLTREGGHTRRRILHAGDITGREVERTLAAHVRATKGLHVCENTLLIDLVTTRFLHDQSGENRVVGAYLLSTETGEIWAVRTGAVILSTGGIGKVYQYTCNPDIATGDGIAAAWRAGAKIRNMEMVQFHPTCLFHPKAKRFLISEAVRGEGAILVTRDGKPFMENYDPRGSLAPRDIVARAIDNEMKKRGDPYCCLDIRHKGEAYLKERFPAIYAKCLEFGIDMARDLIPIVPCPPRTTSAAASLRTSRAAPPCRGSTPSANAPARAFTAPTASPATRSSRPSSAAAPAPTRSAPSPSPPSPTSPSPTGSTDTPCRPTRPSSWPTTGRSFAPACGTTSASSAPTSASAAPSAASATSARRSTNTTSITS